MKMAKATRSDIEAAGDAMSVLQDISSGYYPARDDDGEENPPNLFDPDEFGHLRKFYDMMNATLDKSGGWPGRIIGGMCYVVLYDENKIVDPVADTLELHPRFAAVETQRDELLTALKMMNRAYVNLLQAGRDRIAMLGGACDAVDAMEAADPNLKASRAAIAKAEGGAP